MKLNPSFISSSDEFHATQLHFTNPSGFISLKKAPTKSMLQTEDKARYSKAISRFKNRKIK